MILIVEGPGNSSCARQLHTAYRMQAHVAAGKFCALLGHQAAAELQTEAQRLEHRGCQTTSDYDVHACRLQGCGIQGAQYRTSAPERALCCHALLTGNKTQLLTGLNLSSPWDYAE